MVTGRAGPVVFDMPFDIFKEEAEIEMPQAKLWNANISCRCGADPEGVRKTVDMLLDAKRPVIMVGQGVKYAAASVELVRLAERLQQPPHGAVNQLVAFLIPLTHDHSPPY